MSLSEERLREIEDALGGEFDMWTCDSQYATELLAEVKRLRSIVAGVEALHVKHEQILCGAVAEVPHRHSSEPRRETYPIRPVVCTEERGHEGPHRDALCCWNFQEFTDPTGQKPLSWTDRSSCSHCRAEWPCPTVDLLNPTEGETCG